MPAPVWTSLSIVTLSISLIALCASLTSLWFGWRGHVRAEAQDRRRKPALVIDLLDSRLFHMPNRRIYCFQLRVRNPSDSDNAISIADLWFLFATRAGASLIVKVPHADADVKPPDLGEALAIPSKVGAHNVATGWCWFELTDEVAGDNMIERHDLQIQDTHGLTSTVSARILQLPTESHSDALHQA